MCLHVFQILCLVCASHNGVSESEALDLLPDLELPLLLCLLERLGRLCVVTLRCGLIRFQHLQVSRTDVRWSLTTPNAMQCNACSSYAVTLIFKHSLLCACSFLQAWEAVRLEFLDGGSSSAVYREKLILYFSQQLRC